MGRKRASLRILERALVPEARKSELGRRLARVRGQIQGVERMLSDDRPCVEILTQIAAAQEALRGAGRVMVRNYLERCVPAALGARRADAVYDEMMGVIFKLTR